MNEAKTTNLDRKREIADLLLARLLEKQGGGGVSRFETDAFTPPTASPDADTAKPMQLQFLPVKKKRATPTIRLEKQLPPDVVDKLDDLIEQWGPDGLLGEDGLFRAMTKALVERVLNAELTHHLGYEHGQPPPEEQENRRNGTTPKTLRTNHGPLTVDIPRDRQGTYEPLLVPKHRRSFHGFDEQILSLYGRGLSDREIQAHLQEQYGTTVSPDLISRATNAVVEELNQWQTRPLEAVYPIVYLDALMVKIRDTGVVENKAVYLGDAMTAQQTCGWKSRLSKCLNSSVVRSPGCGGNPAV